MFNPRWQKIWSDLWTNKVRTGLMILSLAAGVFGVGVIMNTQAILNRNFAAGFAAVNPASATLLTDAFDEKWVKAVRRMPEIQEAEGRRKVTVRLAAPPASGSTLQMEPDKWLDLELYAIDNFDDLRVNKVRLESGTWPPPKHQLLLERSARQVAGLAGLATGDTLLVRTADDSLRELRLAGYAFDFNQTPVMGANKLYGYITLDTLDSLGQPRGFNALSFVVAENRLDETYIRQVAGKITGKLEKNGRTVYATVVPTPGEHPMQKPVSAMLFILGTLGSLSLLGSGFLVANMISALMTQQIKQIGLMKAIGARTSQVMSLYLVLIFILSLLALLLAAPLAVGGAHGLASFFAMMLNLNLTDFQIPPRVIAAQVVIGLIVPFMATLYSLRTGTGITVREAISDYGLGQEVFKPGQIDRLLERLRHLPRTFLLSWRNLFRRKGRLALTLTTLSLSGALFVTVASARASLLNTLDESYIYRKYDLRIDLNRPYRAGKIEREALSTPGITNVESFNAVAPVNRRRADGSESDNLLLLALADDSTMFRPPLAQGRWLLPQEQQGVVVNSALLREEPDLKLGDELVLKFEKCEQCNGIETLEERETRWQIVGIFEEAMAPSTVYVNNSAFTHAAGGVGRATTLWVTTAEHELEFVTQTAKALERQFEQADIGINSSQTLRAQYEAEAFHFNIMTLTLMVMAVLMAVVGGLGLMGTMSINVIERTREIGIMRAIGASTEAVFQVFLIESLLVGLLSWPVGVLTALFLGKLLTDAISRIMESALIYTFSLGSVFLWLFIVAFIAVLATLQPAWKAAHLSVRKVLAY
ncbi:MAG: ABC transporter permease [Anaerolineae bacterium]|nr:ABC transporter permease [Anaerolineae bacterium]